MIQNINEQKNQLYHFLHVLSLLLISFAEIYTLIQIFFSIFLSKRNKTKSKIIFVIIMFQSSFYNAKRNRFIEGSYNRSDNGLKILQCCVCIMFDLQFDKILYISDPNYDTISFNSSNVRFNNILFLFIIF